MLLLCANMFVQARTLALLGRVIPGRWLSR